MANNTGIVRLKCYLEEYRAPKGKGVRIREKATARKVTIACRSQADKEHLLRFLNAGLASLDNMPDIFERWGYDYVLVSGVKMGENETDVCIDTDIRTGGYLFGPTVQTEHLLEMA